MKTAADLIEPKGELSKGLFPEDETDQVFEDRLQSYLNSAYALLTQAAIADLALRDKGAIAYAYYRAYDAIYRRLSITPISVSLTDQGARTYSRDQIATFRNLALDWLAEWEEIVPNLTPPPATAPTAPAKTIFTW
jgi:hypothetical protein